MMVTLERRYKMQNTQEKKDKVLFWIRRFIKALLCFFIFYYSGYLQNIPVFLFHITKITPTVQILCSLFANSILVLLVGALYFKDLKKEAKIFQKDFANCMDIGLKYWLLGLFIMMGTNILINTFSSNHIAGNEKAVQQMIETLPWAMLINAGIIAPFTEEITFRKTFRTLFKNKWLFASVAGLVFGAMHVIGNATNIIDWLYVIPYGSLGFCFALAYDESNTIFTPIAFHMIHNTTLTLLSILT